ncbi:ABC-type cobalamin/Fe3+-siderophores transport system ATPase subunit [Amycolatopsis umgeniensis]|uniref:ABC-type cobalamin/Fe3+-siderophores transport system ATPase subunit n=2 Tax=Amycolatopsis umgeniensis TaxID=336628 RepID=A0A841ATM4_9PSEU|nr:ABC-type cobalamin/Fe3+-siderophores transport system ATPase subunit [Amycolatopsis umgeniensis]
MRGRKRAEEIRTRGSFPRRWATRSEQTGRDAGERQRVLVARALAQRTPVLLLDEPTYCDRLVLLRNGRVLAAGPPEEVLEPERVAAAT